MCPKVSVIIPVYNAEKYITECIKSLLNQTLFECEFIFINDGSNDNSEEIIKKYQPIDTRIKLITQENLGVSIARNKGLKVAEGQYIGFVDADDYIQHDMYELLYSAASQSDCNVVICNFQSETDGHRVTSSYPFPAEKILDKSYIEEHIMPYFLKSDGLNSVANKIYRKKIIRDFKIEFPSGVALGEDGIFNMKFFSHAPTVKYLEYAGYHYREVSGSATRNILEKDYFKRALEVYHLELPKFYYDKYDLIEIQKLKSIKLVNNVMSYIHIYFKPSTKLSFKERYRYINNMISHKDVRESLYDFYSESYNMIGRYEKFIVTMMKLKSMMGLYCATAYSRYRNNS